MAMRTAFRTSNPALNSKSFGGFVGVDPRTASSQTATGAMTVQGTVDRTAILLAVTIFAAVWPWKLLFETRDPAVVMPVAGDRRARRLRRGAGDHLQEEWAPVTAPIYAALRGARARRNLGDASSLRYHGIALPGDGAHLRRAGGACWSPTRPRPIRATEGFKLGVIAATGAIVLVYVLSHGPRACSASTSASSTRRGPIGIGFSLVVVGVAALNLVLDFDVVEQGARAGAPKYMEWYGAFGILVTLVWLYLEILRLLAKLNDRR